MQNKIHIKIILTLFVLNVMLSAFYFTVGQNKTLEITPQKYSYKVATDQVLNGKSSASLELNRNKAIMDCELAASDYPWRYCEITINLTDDVEHGLNLSSFDRVYLDIDYHGPREGTDRVRFYIRNYEEEIFNPSDDNSLKYNGIEYHPGEDLGGQDISFTKFQVLTWWLFDYNVPIENAGVNFDNVSMIQIATDSGSILGKHTIKVNKIVFKGSYLSQRWFAYGLLATWIGAALIFLFNELYHLRRRAEKIHAHAKQLDQLNRDLSDKYTQATFKAMKDELTGASNRYAVRDWLENITRRVRWGNAKLAMVYLDLDHFKAVNDNFGHMVGDLVLKEFVRLIQQQLRDNDHLVRWGGEEFIVFCPNASLEGASSLAERIREQVETHSWPQIERRTCSFGVVEMFPGETVREMTARADEALYKAKKNGRNRVEIMRKLA